MKTGIIWNREYIEKGRKINKDGIQYFYSTDKTFIAEINLNLERAGWTCKGDSGAPLYYMENNRPTDSVVAIVNGRHGQAESECGPYEIIALTNLSPEKSWIRKTLSAIDKDLLIGFK